MWKVQKYVKDPAQVEKIEDLIAENVPLLKQVYISLISNSLYPNITWLDFSNFIETLNVIDGRTNLSTIDRLFITTNLEEEEVADNPNRSLCRYEFWEVLVRIAGQKFKEQKICDNYLDAFEKFLKEHLLKYARVEPWQEFRDEVLWTRDVNLVLDANKEGLLKIYSKYFLVKQ